MRSKFNRQLRQLNSDMVMIGAMAEDAIAVTMKCISEDNVDGARSVIENDSEIDNKERSIETLCLKLLLRQQPVAGDLRLISSALKMLTDIERIGDQAADICEIFIKSDSLKGGELPQCVSGMAREAIYMVNAAVDAFVKKDINLAKSVKEYDAKVDDFFNRIKTELISEIKSSSDNEGRAIDILMIAKYLEKIGDHAVNIAEWVMFSITGEHGGE